MANPGDATTLNTTAILAAAKTALNCCRLKVWRMIFPPFRGGPHY
jgi:hypothetical protein